MPLHIIIVIITNSINIRALSVPFHNVSSVDTVREPFDMLLPRVIIVTQPPLKPSTTMETAGFISVPCEEMKDRYWTV